QLDIRNRLKDLFIKGDPNLLFQALSNIVMNSVEAYDEKEPAVVLIEIDKEIISREAARLYEEAREGEFVRIRVSDKGCGMPGSVVEKAFHPLYTTKEERGCSGLGLTAAYAIVRAHNGFMTLESRPEKGTTVTIYLPLAKQEEESKVVPLSAARKRNLSTNELSQEKEGVSKSTKSKEPTKILIVDDDASVRDAVQKMFKVLGYDAETCSDPDQALTLCREKEFKLVVVDMLMPRIRGDKLINQLKTSSKGVKTVLMTGAGLKKSSTESAVLTKPFDINTLKSVVEEVLRE
ncbi:MAG: response regulator, partial [Candidatus Dadabacteria bacterium]